MPEKTAKRLWTYLIIVLLALVCALNYQLFVFPNRFAPAGLNGICTMIQYLTGISVGYLSLLINIPLALLVLVKVGRSLALRSMLYVTAFSLFLIVLGEADLSRFAYETANGTSRILGPLVAGVIYGTCASLLVRSSCSTGGTDFVAAVIHRSHPEQSFFWITFAINAMVAVSSYFVYDFEMEPVILCILYSFMSSTVSDHLMKGYRSAIRFEIITDDPQQIAEAIIHKLHHSATLVPARGMYLGKETNVLICIINKAQAPALAAILQEYPNAFAVMSGVNEVVGNFKRMTPQGKLEREILDKGDGKTV
ncbi:MAG: YitT family protein [Oscillospiraceae bacterium]